MSSYGLGICVGLFIATVFWLSFFGYISIAKREKQMEERRENEQKACNNNPVFHGDSDNYRLGYKAGWSQNKGKH